MMQFNFLVQLQLFLIFGSREFCPVCVHKKEIIGKIASLQEHSYWVKQNFRFFSMFCNVYQVQIVNASLCRGQTKEVRSWFA